jgi:hypothetical protein
VFVGKFDDDKVEGSGRFFSCEVALEKVWFECAVSELPAQAAKEMKKQRRSIGGGIGSPLAPAEQSPAAFDPALARNGAKSFMASLITDREDLDRYLTSMRARGYDNMVGEAERGDVGLGVGGTVRMPLL